MHMTSCYSLSCLIQGTAVQQLKSRKSTQEKRSSHKRKHRTVLREQLFIYSYKYTAIHPHHHFGIVLWVLEVINFVSNFTLISLLLNHMDLVNGDLFPSLKIF